MRSVPAMILITYVIAVSSTASAAPPCQRDDAAILCTLAQETLADNPTFAQMREGGPDAERARLGRHAERRAQVRALLNELSAPTWRDLYRAGYVVAYGDTPEDDLLAWAIAIRALSLAPDEADVRFLVAMTADEIGRRYVGAQLYGRQKYFAFDPRTGSVARACLPQMLDPPLPQSVGSSFHSPGDGYEPCPAGVGATSNR